MLDMGLRWRSFGMCGPDLNPLKKLSDHYNIPLVRPVYQTEMGEKSTCSPYRKKD